jgi:hypothetical protein
MFIAFNFWVERRRVERQIAADSIPSFDYTHNGEAYMIMCGRYVSEVNKTTRYSLAS